MSKSLPETPAPRTPKKLPKNSTPDANPLADLLHALGPIVDFHKAVETANDHDLRIFWDVRVIRGSNEIFVTSSGSSSMPGILSPKLRPTAATLIQQEVADKIAAPLVGHMQTVIETGVLEGALRKRGEKEDNTRRLGNGMDTVEDARRYE